MLLLEPSLGCDEPDDAEFELQDARPVPATAGPDLTVRGPTAT